MSRFLAFASIAALLTAAAHAQCFTAPTGASITGAGFVKWSAGSGYASALDLDDEGITNPPIALTAFANFPMAGAVGNLNQIWVSSNGEVYLTDSTLALAQPVGGATYGVDTLAEMRGVVVNGSARVVSLGDDLESSAVGGSAWDIRVDQSVPGQVRVIWIDVGRYATTTDRFSFDCTLFASGEVQFTYSTPIVGDVRYSGISIGNMVGTATSPSRDLTAAVPSDSGAEGMLYEAFTAVSWDLTGRGVMILPNGLGGYQSILSCEPAFHAAYGTGCYNIPLSNDSVYQHWTTLAGPSAALPGNVMQLIPTADGYAVLWNAGAAAATYIAPGGGAVSLPLTDDGTHTITPSSAVPSPFGPASTLAISHNGIITFGATPNNAADFTPTAAEFLASTGAGFYSWYDYYDGEAGSGTIKYEEVGGVLCVTWDNVEGYQGGVNPFSFQYQFDLATGNVNMVWNVVPAAGLAAREYLVGYTDAGPSSSLGAIDLPTQLPLVTTPDISPLTLSASPPPVFTPGGPTVPITYTVNNVIDVVPPFGIGITLLLFSVAPIPGGIDAGFLDMPGCNLYVATIDVLLVPSGTAPVSTLTISIPQPLAPGLSFYSQALSLFTPNSLPGGLNNFGGVLSNGLQSSFQLQ